MPSYSAYANNSQLLARWLAEIEQRLNNVESKRATWTGVENVVPRTGDPPYVKGDLLTHDGSRFRKLALGANNETLIADDTFPEGVRWAVATEKAFDLQPFVSVQADLFAVASTTILSATESGLLQGVGLHVVNATGATGTATVDITVDGGTKRSLSVYNGSTIWDTDGFLPLATRGDGNVAQDTAWLPLNIRYLTSILVAFDVTNVFAAGDLIDVNVLRAIAL